MRFKVTYKLPIPISVIIDDARNERHALEQANLVEEVRFALACLMVDGEWKGQSDQSAVSNVSVDVETIPDLEPELGLERII